MPTTFACTRRNWPRSRRTSFWPTFVRGGGALLVGTGAFTNSHRERIVALAARHALPGIYSSGRFFTEIGGLMSC